MRSMNFIMISAMFMLMSFFFFLTGLLFKMNSLTIMVEFPILNWNSLNFSYEILLDWISMGFGSVVFMVSSSVMIYSKSYMNTDKTQPRFILLMVSFVTSMLLMITSGGLLSLMLGWDGLGVTSYILVIYYQNYSSYKSGILTIMTNRLGDILIILSITILTSLASWSYISIDKTFLSSMLMVAACTKSAQVPFSAWLPEAMAAPTPVSSLVHSSTLVTAGVFMLIRLQSMLSFSVTTMSILKWLSLLTMLVGGFSAMIEMDMKKIVASSTLSQLGLMMFSLANNLWSLTYFHSIMHAFFKSLMFLSIGVILHMENGNQDLRLVNPKFKSSWIVNQGLLTSILCLMGFPFSCAFYSKDLLLSIYLSLDSPLLEKFLFIMSFSLSMIYGPRLFYMTSILTNDKKTFGVFKESMFSSISILILLIMSISTGVMYSWYQDEFLMAMVNKNMSLVSPLISILGSLLILLSKLTSNLFPKKNYFNFSFLKSMSFLSNLTGSSANKSFKKMNDFTTEDKTWKEDFSGGGLLSLFKAISNYHNMKMTNFLQLFLFFFLILMII